MTQPIYAVGDIHGQLTELERVLDLIADDGGADAEIVFLGDYTDRGPDSRGVLDVLIAGQKAGKPWTCLMGNHDRMFRMFLQSPPQDDPYLMVELYWLHPRLGGDTTLASYGVDASGTRRVQDVHADTLDAVPQSHIAFLNTLDVYADRAPYLFVHAGIRPGVPLSHQTEEDLIWIRKEFHRHIDPHSHIVVHGHTPVKEATHYGNRINLDTGAGYGNPLSVAVFDATGVSLLTGSGRQLLRP